MFFYVHHHNHQNTIPQVSPIHTADMIIMIMIMNLSNEYLTMGTNHKVHHHVCITERFPIFKVNDRKKAKSKISWCHSKLLLNIILLKEDIFKTAGGLVCYRLFTLETCCGYGCNLTRHLEYCIKMRKEISPVTKFDHFVTKSN